MNGRKADKEYDHVVDKNAASIVSVVDVGDGHEGWVGDQSNQKCQEGQHQWNQLIAVFPFVAEVYEYD